MKNLCLSILPLLMSVSIVFAQPAVVVTAEDIEICFPTYDPALWISGADATQDYFTVDSITYSDLALRPSTDVIRISSGVWEAEMWGSTPENFRKAIMEITLMRVPHPSYRTMFLRVRNRYEGSDRPGLWNVSTETRIIGKPGKVQAVKQ